MSVSNPARAQFRRDEDERRLGRLMMLTRIQHIAVIALCVVAACCLVLITRHALPLLDSWNGASTLKKANDTLDAINAPCTGFHGSETCGVLAQAAQTEKNVGILAGQSALQVKQSAKLVDSATVAVSSAAQDVHGMSVAVAGTASEATGTLHEATESIAAFQPLAASLTRTTDASTRAVQDFDDLVKNPMWEQMGQNVVGMTHSGDLILADGSRVSKKFADDYTRKQTPWMRIWRIAGDTYDLAAFGARHTP
ncbi:hypothetical protein KGP36_08370 [Patescibacteria group bacterium]|nr:hypothetical protein [Patescibacteria group bacterium]